ncbi:hypothetical protein BDS110ZK23_24550 [Bradyrhizobium diazoefficiens]|uniref:DUF3987 domain-containing protein n=1 Tax=Bradyrhizobium diazoefficiens TaxID=1355477 RepID=A0A810BTV4_9BRAD|nr:hypothetical protein XF9B_09050 [Bradyrhizobium diazoefficiens]BCE96884.1 hypothetical protein XF11B_09050 [Bradyrhizobium diazoefficiens]BCF05535.1 hypothetical protein XF12B_09080 [Bradyrhizobium diazoefficiens]BCF57955.1 hypothetical protein XF18B_09030 [Bradyrhizobium diazoefficiens]
MRGNGRILSNQNITQKEITLPNRRDELLKQCSDLAENPYILGQLSGHLREHGFAGSTNNPLMVYLSTLTRMFDDPVSAVIKGRSSSGKSFALHAGLRYVPDAAYHLLHGLSSKSLLHAAKHNLKNRFLIIQEAAGFGSEGWPFLRQMLTEGKLNYMTVKQTREGHEGAVLATVEGPMGVLMTTTQASLHGEEETRLLSLYADQSPEQIREALMMNARKSIRPTPEDLSRWHALHDWVCSGNTSVEIPYVETLLSKLPTSYPRVLRDTPKLIALIRAHAMLHQMSRDCRAGSIIATFEDYASVYPLVEEALSNGLKASVPRHIAEVVNAVCELHRLFAGSVSQRDVADYLRQDQGNVSRNISTAVEEGFVENKNPGQGRVHEYVPGKRELPSSSVLPTPQELETAYAKLSQHRPIKHDHEELMPTW